MVRRIGSTALAAMVFALAPVPATAAEPDPALTRRPPPARPLTAERVLEGASDVVDASDALDEMIDELAADFARLGAPQVSPMVIERITVSSNVDPKFASLLEARIVAAVFRGAGVAVVRCPECRATRSTVEEGAWVVKRGLTTRDEITALSSQGAKAVLRAWFTVREAPDSLALDVEVARTSDASIVFAEGYRVDPQTTLLYRGADTAEKRAERLADLEDRIEKRPRFGQAVFFGAMIIPDKPLLEDVEDLGPILGGFGSYRLFEQFGPTREFKVGLNLGGFIHSSRLAGGVVTASVHGRLTSASWFGPNISLGLAGGGFITGGGGNTPMGSVHLEVMFGHRLAIQGSLSWIHPFKVGQGRVENPKNRVGGLTPQMGMGFVW